MLIAMACTAPPASQGDDLLAARADKIVTESLENGPFPGVAVSISRNGETIFAKGYGLANIEFDAPVSTETVFPIASITKSFTALAIAQLAVDGKLSLDDAVSDYIDDFPPEWGRIKVRHLLNHTGGIFNYTEDPRIHQNPGRHYSHDEMRAFFESKPLAFEAGAQFSYSNSGSYLLGMVIENVSGQSYGEYLKANIFEPFGLTDTVYPDFSHITKGRAHGYHAGQKGVKNSEPFSPTIPFSAGALLSTLADLEKFSEAVHQSDLVSDEIREILYTHDTLEDGSSLQYTLGALIIRDANGRRKISHSGKFFGTASHDFV